jgi:hypothetical protein
MHFNYNLLTYFKQVLKACSSPLQYIFGFYKTVTGNDFLVLHFFQQYGSPLTLQDKSTLLNIMKLELQKL